MIFAINICITSFFSLKFIYAVLLQQKLFYLQLFVLIMQLALWLYFSKYFLIFLNIIYIIFCRMIVSKLPVLKVPSLDSPITKTQRGHKV